MSLGEISQNFFPVFINTVKEEVFNLNFVRESAGLYVSHLLNLLLLLVKLSLHSIYLILFMFVEGSEKVDDLIFHCVLA